MSRKKSIRQSLYDQENKIAYMEYLGMQDLLKCNIDIHHVSCRNNMFDKLREQKEQRLREAIISCGYLPEQVINDRVKQERFELRNICFEPAGIHQYILTDKRQMRSFILMQELPYIELGFTTFQNKEVPFNYHR